MHSPSSHGRFGHFELGVDIVGDLARSHVGISSLSLTILLNESGVEIVSADGIGFSAGTDFFLLKHSDLLVVHVVFHFHVVDLRGQGVIDSVRSQCSWPQLNLAVAARRTATVLRICH